jgi:GH25 family lysozyme M1 (1,4-beta-N-acetylmuramidase)
LEGEPVNITVDYAGVDGNELPSWPTLRQACQAAGSVLGGVIFRGAWGSAPDETVARDWANARGAGLIRGAYLFLRARQSPVDQVHAFVDNVGPLNERDFPPILDIEDPTFESAEAELEEIHEAWCELRMIYGAPPMIYTSARVWTEDLHGHDPGEMSQSPLWVAKPWPWPARSSAVLSPAPFASGRYDPPVPTPWGPGNWWMHQYQGDALPCPGFSHTVDLSRFHLMVQGETGPRVRWVQRQLRMPTPAVDGIFGPDTASTLRAFQRSRGLVVDAIIGPKTFCALAWNA